MKGIFGKGSVYTSSVLLSALIVSLSGCASLGGGTTEVDNRDGATELSTSEIINDGSASTVPVDVISSNVTAATPPTTLAARQQAGVGISYAQNNNNQLLTIDTGNAKSSYIASRLENPSRIVLDITNSKVKRNTTVTPPQTDVVSSVRLGAHEDKSRIVIDLASAAKEDITQSGSQIIVALTSNQAILNQSASQQLAEKSGADNSQLLADNHLLEQNNKLEEIESTTEAPVTIKEPIQLSSGQRVLSNLNIETIPGQGNVIIADVSNLKDFEFKKTAQSEYIATLRGVTLDPVANQTVLAKPRSGSIRSVRPIEKDGDVILRVFAQPEAELTALMQNNTLVIKNLDPNSVEYMAQAKAEPTLITTPKADSQVPAEKSDSAKDESADLKLSKSTGNFSTLNSDGRYTGRLISLDLQDTDIDNALRIIAEVSNLNIIASSDVQGKVTLRLIDVPWDQALDVILKTNGLDKVQEGNVVRIAPVEKLRLEREALKQAQLAEEELEALGVKYVRISYARADDLKPMIKSVLSERGDVAVDTRTNQLIIKDIKKGIKNASELISKLDLRTPQVLLETQIIEANRSFLRDLGSQLGFSFIQSPETGNATGFNFPNSVKIGGGIPNSTNASNFPATISGLDGGAAMALAFGSADGTKSLDANISALEREGRVRIVSRPSVATTNNKAAEITSNETVSVLMPNGGINTVVGGNGGGGAGPGQATEKIKAGITLKVTPQASPDYYILMDIQAESSNFGSKIFNGIPNLFERKATSTVLVSSGQTFAIGGIYRTTDKDSIRGVPFLKDIPVLGNFFSGNTIDTSDEELLFFITPRIIEGSFDDAAMTSES
jgi:type IV pilus secretin PilQ/predicted competence protein